MAGSRRAGSAWHNGPRRQRGRGMRTRVPPPLPSRFTPVHALRPATGSVPSACTCGASVFWPVQRGWPHLSTTTEPHKKLRRVMPGLGRPCLLGRKWREREFPAGQGEEAAGRKPLLPPPSLPPPPPGALWVTQGPPGAEGSAKCHQKGLVFLAHQGNHGHGLPVCPPCPQGTPLLGAGWKAAGRGLCPPRSRWLLCGREARTGPHAQA